MASTGWGYTPPWFNQHSVSVPGVGKRLDPPSGKVAFYTQAGDGVMCWVNGVAKALPSTFGGYGSTQRTGRRARTTYQGVDVVGMTVPVLFDGWATRTSVNADVRKLGFMAQPSGPGELTPPQPVYVVGSVLPMTERWWVIQSLEWGDNMRRSPADDSRMLRQDAVVTLIQPPEDGVIITNGKRYTVRPGDTLHSIASRQLGKASRWRDITDSKGRKIRDAKSIKPGQIVRLP
jgi:hypothetical protein